MGKPKELSGKEATITSTNKGTEDKESLPTIHWVLNLWAGATNKDVDAEFYSYCHAITQQDGGGKNPNCSSIPTSPPTDISHTREWKWSDHLMVNTHIQTKKKW